MNKKTMILGIFIGTITVAEVAVLVASYTTDIFKKNPGGASQTAVADTLKKKAKKSPPPRTTQPAPVTAPVAAVQSVKKDTLDRSAELQKKLQVQSDSIAVLSAALAAEQKKSTTLADQVRSLTVKQNDVKEQKRKEIQKIYNTMDAESAARIIARLGDQEVLDILLSVQKRQAAKILASLDPTRAAKLINQVNTTNTEEKP